jgi:hypothetical protein
MVRLNRTAVFRFAISTAVAAAVFAGACGDSTAPDMATLTPVAASNNQRGIAGFALAIPLAVRVTNSADQPLVGVTVTWTVTSGNGTVSPATSVTNDNGVAETRWTLGPGEGPQTGQATANGTSTTFSATATSQTLTLNANAQDACANPNNRQGRVVAVSANAIAVEDQGNPPGEFTAADYAEILSDYERFVHPVDVLNFGGSTDIDGNGKSIIFFTRVVNELTPPNSTTGFVAGFFFARDLFPKTDTPRLGACPASNVAEMFYMLAPDTNGVVNGNKFGPGFVKRITVGTIAHEFQHLINSSRRLYINTTAEWPETTWMEEGLSHIAEELVFYEASGLGPRQNIDLPRVQSSQQIRDATNRYMISNLGRFRAYLQKTAVQSPYGERSEGGDSDDDLETRGATWSFFRYAADRPGPSAHSACGATIDLSVGGVCLAAPDRASNMQISGGSTGAEFVAIPYYDGNFSRDTVSVTATATGATAAAGPPNPSLAPLFSSTLSSSALRLMPNLAFERRLRNLERRVLRPRVAGARAWYAERLSRTSLRPTFNATVLPQFATLVDGDVWMRLANGPDTGVTNLRAVFGTGVNDQLRAWAAAHYTDDAVTTGNAALQHPSWNFRSLLPALRQPPDPYPLATLLLTDVSPQTFTLVDGGAAYLRFGVVAGTSATVRLNSGSGVLPAGASVWIVRTK